MANASLLVTWGNPIPGRENQALEIFMGIVQKYTGLQAGVLMHDDMPDKPQPQQRLG